MNKVDLHIFSVASLEAMCMVAYLRKQENGKVAFVIGKCRVAPIRNMTVAKLEMQAAVFGVRLRELILEEHDIEVDQIVHWTDSTTVLQWIFSTTTNPRDMKLGTPTQVPNTNTPATFQGHSPTITPFTPHMCGVKGLCDRKMYSSSNTKHDNG